MPTLRKIKRAAMQPHKTTQIAAHLILPNRTQSPPTTQLTDNKKHFLTFGISQYICTIRNLNGK